MIILASKSPRRKEILEKHHIPYQAIASLFDESQVQEKDPIKLVQLLALKKATSIATNYPDQLVLGADTIVYYDGVEYGKPKDEKDAFRMLKTFSGKTHQVYTGVSLIKKSINFQVSYIVRSDVTFKELKDREIEDYINSGEPFDKAGAYAIQGLGGALVESYSGPFENIMGLPFEYLKENEFKKLPEEIKKELLNV